MNRISIVCLGVRDMQRALAFYRDRLGFKTAETGDNPPVVFFDTPGTKFELFPLENLVKDINDTAPPVVTTEFSGITLAYNVKLKSEVDSVIECARSAGATIIKEPVDVFWGGYHAYFSDYDGYVWEVAWGPDFKYDENDMLIFE